MRVGFWPPVYGNWLMTPDAASCDASFETTKTATILADRLGFDTMLIAEHFINPLGPSVDVLDAWTTAAGLAVATENIEIIAAVKPGLRAPGVVAKMAANIDEMSAGRFAINLVAAWWLPEYEMLGAEVLDHDTRWARADEFLRIVKGLWTRDKFNFDGAFYKIKDATISPRPTKRPNPPIYLGGESDVGKDLAAEIADIYVFNGRKIEEIRPLVADMRARGARFGRDLRFGMAGFVICRDTEEEAEAELERLAKFKNAVVTGTEKKVAMNDPDKRAQVGVNGGVNAGLVGTPRQIADRMRAFEAEGIETFLLTFHPTLPELERFGRDVLPLLRA